MLAGVAGGLGPFAGIKPEEWGAVKMKSLGDLEGFGLEKHWVGSLLFVCLAFGFFSDNKGARSSWYN